MQTRACLSKLGRYTASNKYTTRQIAACEQENLSKYFVAVTQTGLTLGNLTQRQNWAYLLSSSCAHEAICCSDLSPIVCTDLYTKSQ